CIEHPGVIVPKQASGLTSGQAPERLAPPSKKWRENDNCGVVATDFPVIFSPEMKKLLILGAGTAGTMMANRLRKKLSADKWAIVIVDQYPKHYYQPGFLFMPFGIYSEKDIIKPKRKFIPQGVDYIEAEIDRIQAEQNRVLL